MKALYFILLGLLYVNASPRELLGAKQCTWGPSYWCSNLTAAAGCHAVKHCIQTVWEQKVYPEDTDTICQTCISMVKQARDQLESNETQEEIKEVFEGSCKLIPLKLVNEECCKLADQFIPELVDTLASQMNPQVVCSVAGLCNNAKIDKLLAEQANQVVTKQPAKKMDTCTGCHKVVDIMESKFNGMTRDNFLQNLLHLCGRMSSFSDACSNIVVTYFSDIYKHMQENFNSNNVCLMSGECSANFHVHKVEITPLSDVGFVQPEDDPPCELCKQLIGHLRDLLIADTTELEFQKVLQGLCKETGSFREQCLSIVNEYYPVIYKYLVQGLNSTIVCNIVGICPGPGLEDFEASPIIPLLPVESVEQLSRVGIPKDDASVKVMSGKTEFESQSPELMQLPIERMNSPHVNNVYNKELCVFCEYFLHYAQQAITNPKTDQQIKDVINKACDKLPSSIHGTCIEFVSTYGDAFVALLAQEIDPSTICPLIQVCPGARSQDIEIFMQGTKGDKPNCPLCLFAVTKLEEMVKDSRTRSNIKTALKTLCSHLSGNVAEECQDFVNTYADELIEMLADDFKPQEVCVYLKLCKDSKPAPQISELNFGGSISTNEILDFTSNGKIINPSYVAGNKPQCVLCEFVMEKLQTALENKSTEEEIKREIHSICNMMPKSINQECNDFVNKYADVVFDLIIASAKPDEICAMMNLCDKKTEIDIPKNVGSPQCVICKLVMTQIESLLVGKVSEDDIKNALDTVCSILPRAQEKECKDFIKKNGDAIYKLLVVATAPGEICSLLFLCDTQQPQVIRMKINECAVCETTVMIIDRILQNPKVDHSIEHVLEKACRALPVKNQKTCKNLIEEYGNTIFSLVNHFSDKSMVCKEIGVCGSSVLRPKRAVMPGSEKCSWGPGYWCASAKNAEECGLGAHKHCTEIVWKGTIPE